MFHMLVYLTHDDHVRKILLFLLDQRWDGMRAGLFEVPALEDLIHFIEFINACRRREKLTENILYAGAIFLFEK